MRYYTSRKTDSRNAHARQSARSGGTGSCVSRCGDHKGRPRYAEGSAYCSTCVAWIASTWEGRHCPCCGRHLRHLRGHHKAKRGIALKRVVVA